jgi:hypothetical protein
MGIWIALGIALGMDGRDGKLFSFMWEDCLSCSSLASKAHCCGIVVGMDLGGNW